MEDATMVVSNSFTKMKQFILNALNTFSGRQWLLLILLLVSGISYQFGYSTPGSLQRAIMVEYELSDYRYSFLYSSYSLSAIFFSVFCGYLIDGSLGPKRTTILFSIISVIGMAVFAFGVYFHIFWLMVMGRLIYGSGQESSYVVCLTYYSFIWFKNNHVNMVMAMSDSLAFLGTAAVYQFSYRFQSYVQNTFQTSPRETVSIVLIVDSCIVFIFFIGNVTVSLLKQERILNISMVESKNEVEESVGTVNDSYEVLTGDLPHHAADTVSIKDMFHFPLSYWLICITFAVICNVVYTFEQFSQQIFTQLYSMDVHQASDAVTVITTTKLSMCIVISFLIDKFGRNLSFLIASLIICLTAHVCLIIRVNAYFCMVILGTSYTLASSSIWALYVYPLQKIHYGLGYGIGGSFNNLTSFIFPFISGKIIDNFGLFWIEVFFIGVLIFGLLCSFVAWLVDKVGDAVLNMTPDQRTAHHIRSDN